MDDKNNNAKAKQDDKERTPKSGDPLERTMEQIVSDNLPKDDAEPASDPRQDDSDDEN